MNYQLEYTETEIEETILLPISKSECNRLLVAQYLSGYKFLIDEISDSDDSQILKKCLTQIKSETIFHVNHAGTALRFLTALFSITPGTRVLTGSNRLKERPIAPLVNALRELGAEIEYLENENFAPIKIKGKKLVSKALHVEAGISSQFVSALMLISPYIEGGLNIQFKNKPVSFSYLVLTASIMKKLGVEVDLFEDKVIVKQGDYSSVLPVKSERDWTSASYWYEFVALSNNVKIKLPGLFENSLQGDVALKDIFTFFGVSTVFNSDGLTIFRNNLPVDQFAFDFSDSPDLVQTITVTASVLNLPVILNGVSTLKHKETDRVEALKIELKKIGVHIVEIDNTSFKIQFDECKVSNDLTFLTYQDHRMAMCLAPLVIKYKKIKILNPEVVTKSYPKFWEHLLKMGVTITEV